VKILYQYKDELILLLESILQWFYLHCYSALAGEHYYGLKRTANHRLRSLIFSVFLPYTKLKLDALQKQMQSDTIQRNVKFYIILQIASKIHVSFDRFRCVRLRTATTN
jgi:Pex2 / Pex12 amino terminal region